MHYLVAGAAGFIGSHLCERLLNDGHTVTGVDNYLTGKAENLEALAGRTGFEFVEHDITRPLPTLPAPDVVMNLASPASPRDYLAFPVETLRVGSEGTRHLLEFAAESGARFLLASTSECYGDPLEHPQRESYWGHVNPVGPRSCYDEAKRYAEAITMAFHRAHGLRTNIARIFNTFGPRMKLDDGRVVPAFLSQALRGEPVTVFGTGLQTRSFCYVTDLVDGLVRLSRSEERLPVNLGNPVEMTMLEFAERIKALTGAASEITFLPLPEDDPQRRRPDITKAREVLGWAPRVPLEEGLRVTVEYFRTRATGQ
ncbi:MAG: SDR family oxidoreductase [Bryobacteraceae bacterium]|nr:SDR family oxidoreductase [Bryobacteraceae bacterium]